MSTPANSLSRLEKTLFRLQAQHACLAYAFDYIADRPGPVAELGLGHGRTFDHLRRHLPGREIWVFDRANDAYADCQPDPAYLVLGEIEQTLPPLYEKLGGKVVLANSDIGSFNKESNRLAAQMASRVIPPLMAPGGIVMSDLPLTLEGFEVLPLPEGAPKDRYFLYRKPE